MKIIVGSAAGSAPDTFARWWGDHLTKILGQAFIVDNKPGAAGSLSAGLVASATDQHTLLWAISSTMTINPHVYPKTTFDVRKDFVPVAPAMKQAMVLVVNNDFPARTLQDIVQMARKSPGSISYGSYGVAGYPHVLMEWFCDATGIRMVHVPYKQAAIIDVIAGQIPMVAEPTATALAQIRAGKVRPIAFSGGQRLPALPDVPTFAEVYPAVGEVAAFHGVYMPSSTPRDVVNRLNAAMNQVSNLPETGKKVGDMGAQPYPATPEQMAAEVAQEYARWGKFLREKNIKLE
ncbi:MAG: tripartite tricarboxylate transporter substrate binding protein [Pseudomonadota bacterium]